MGSHRGATLTSAETPCWNHGFYTRILWIPKTVLTKLGFPDRYAFVAWMARLSAPGAASKSLRGGKSSRSVADRDPTSLALAFDVVAGPEEERARIGYQLALPPSRHNDLNSFRVLAIDIAHADGHCLAQRERSAAASTESRSTPDARPRLTRSGEM